MTTALEKLNLLIPNGLSSSSSRQAIIDATYKNNLGEKLLVFIQNLAFNVNRRMNGKQMTIPRVNWNTVGSVSLTCNDNLTLYGVLGNSTFLRIANTYAHNVQVHKKYLYMRSQGKFTMPALKPN